ncbi:TonB-dependent receptor plug domain-containing protein [Hyphomicrobium sp. NDB2Meth4]|uniref:TonB-dependent receptor plug domain-containing protein n=1 Tax=Hyphomicrobium sp. NDB2Meth4 TaxID=1892846 RepID=UPI00093072C4|nr:TonB-dependent receptor plug domain-containing protein [Hyphomicrobium sp. NDB2Meth4]
MGAASAAAQETAEPDAAAASETSGASGAADAADGDNKTKNSAALPGLVVETSPKPAEKKAAKKNKGTTTAAAPAAAGEDTQPEVPGIVYGQALSDTGTTTFDSNSVNLRTDGGGDANTFLRNLPNVQYQDQTDDEPGATAGKSIDTKPLLLSISGGRTYENNFILNGVSISNITGPVDWSDNLPADDASTPVANNIYGLHPQTVYVPTEFIGQATIIDSNASAEYGQFQGGVVVYDRHLRQTAIMQASVRAVTPARWSTTF